MTVIDPGAVSAIPGVVAAKPQGGGKFRRVVETVFPPLVVFAIVLAIWYFISYVVMNEARRRVALPAPHTVLMDGFLTWEEKRGLKPILEAMQVSGFVALVGLLIATVLGMGTAIAMNRARWIERSLFPYAVFIQTLPILALVPLIKLWADTGVKGRIIACVLVAIFPIITNTLFGLKSADRAHHDLFTLHGANRWTRLTQLELPGAMPAIFTGLRIAAGGSVIGAIVGDFFFRKGSIGVGRLIDNYQKDSRTAELFATAIVSSLFGIAIFVVFGVIANRYLRSWHDSASADI